MSKIIQFHQNVLIEHDILSKKFYKIGTEDITNILMCVVQYHAMTEGYIKNLVKNIFLQDLNNTIHKDIERYHKIALSLSSFQEYDKNILEINPEWIKKKIQDYPMINSFTLNKKNFERLFALITPKKYDIEDQMNMYCLQKTVFEFSNHIDKITQWRSKIVHNFYYNGNIPNTPNGLWGEVIEDKKNRQEFTKTNKNLLKFIFIALREECM